MIDFENLPARTEMQSMVSDLGYDDTLQYLNIAREYIYEKEPTDDQSFMGVLLARRIRELRETSKTKAKAKKVKEPDAPLADVLKDILPGL